MIHQHIKSLTKKKEKKLYRIIQFEKCIQQSVHALLQPIHLPKSSKLIRNVFLLSV